MAPFSVCQSPNLASYFQKKERISCLKLVLSVALVCAAEHMACSGSPQHDINWSSWLGDRLIKCKKMHVLSDLSALCFVYVMWCDFFFFVHLHHNIYVFPSMNCSWGNCLTKTKKVVQVLFLLLWAPPVSENSCADGFPWIYWTFEVDAAGSARSVCCEVWCVKGQPWVDCYAPPAVWKQDGMTTWLFNSPL